MILTRASHLEREHGHTETIQVLMYTKYVAHQRRISSLNWQKRVTNRNASRCDAAAAVSDEPSVLNNAEALKLSARTVVKNEN